MQGQLILNHKAIAQLTGEYKQNFQDRYKANNIVDNHITGKILGNAFKIHSSLGPGLLESAYEECLFYELNKADLKVEKQKPLPLKYKDIKLDTGYRLDLLVENKVIVEIKAVDAITDIHVAQMQTYLKLSGCKVGLLINFNVKSLRQGIKRVVQESYPALSPVAV